MFNKLLSIIIFIIFLTVYNCLLKKIQNIFFSKKKNANEEVMLQLKFHVISYFKIPVNVQIQMMLYINIYMCNVHSFLIPLNVFYFILCDFLSLLILEFGIDKFKIPQHTFILFCFKYFTCFCKFVILFVFKFNLKLFIYRCIDIHS